MRTIGKGGQGMKEKEGPMIMVDAVEVEARTTVCNSVFTTPLILPWRRGVRSSVYFFRSRQKTSKVDISVGP